MNPLLGYLLFDVCLLVLFFEMEDIVCLEKPFPLGLCIHDLARRLEVQVFVILKRAWMLVVAFVTSKKEEGKLAGSEGRKVIVEVGG